MMKKHPFFDCRFVALIILCSSVYPAFAQRAGDNVSVQYGVVTSGRQVDLQSDAVPGGAVVGGALGIVSGAGKSSRKKARNAIVGAAAGGAIAGAARGDTRGMLYDVELPAQGTVQVVSDQREIQIGDCVAVEKAGETANIRRMSSSYCDPVNEQAINSVKEESMEEAEECYAAKQQLVDADTTSAVELAEKKISLLCND